MFIVNGLIGEGGFGKVMVALSTTHSTWYAIKEINKAQLARHRTGEVMIKGELRALKRLKNGNPFVTSLHFSFSDSQSFYIILDLKTGGDLRYYLKRHMIFEERDVAFYVACLSSALMYLHGKGVIHRDIKPENIILDERGYPHLTDFGVAYVQDTSEREQPLLCRLASGTKQYLAPEVFCKAHLHGPQTDFWGLAVVAYEMLYSERPHTKHCPIPMIEYLEASLNARRKIEQQQKPVESQYITSPMHSRYNSSPTPSLSSSFNSQSTLTGSSPSSLPSPSPSSPVSHSSLHSPSRSVKTSLSISNKSSSLPLLTQTLTSACTAIATTNDNVISHDKTKGYPLLKCAFTPCRGSPSPSPNHNPLISPTGSGVTDSSNTPTRMSSKTSPWLVDDGPLSTSLKVPIPRTGSWGMKITQLGVSFLEEIFDIRPSHRLGCDRFDALCSHPWLAAQGIKDWDALEKKQTNPFYRPGKRFIRDVFENRQPESFKEKHINESMLSPSQYGERSRQDDFMYVAPGYLNRGCNPFRRVFDGDLYQNDTDKLCTVGVKANNKPKSNTGRGAISGYKKTSEPTFQFDPSVMETKTADLTETTTIAELDYSPIPTATNRRSASRSGDPEPVQPSPDSKKMVKRRSMSSNAITQKDKTLQSHASTNRGTQREGFSIPFPKFGH